MKVEIMFGVFNLLTLKVLSPAFLNKISSVELQPLNKFYSLCPTLLIDIADENIQIIRL